MTSAYPAVTNTAVVHDSVKLSIRAPYDAWTWSVATVYSSAVRIYDDGIRLVERLNLHCAINISGISDNDLHGLRALAQPPIRGGSPDAQERIPHYRSLIGNTTQSGPLRDIVEQLRMKRESKSATLCLHPTSSHEPLPCLTSVDFKLRSETLTTFAFFRSQDVWRRQPENVAFLTELATEVANSLEASPDLLNLYIASAHIYECDIPDVTAHLHHYWNKEPAVPLLGHRPTIAIVGRERVLKTDEYNAALASAREAGFLLAARGAIIITGGLGGIMEAAAQGVALCGGVSIGIIPEIHESKRDSRTINIEQSLAITTGMKDRERIPFIVDSCDALLVINGGGGTRIEVEHGLRRGIPVIVLDGSGGVANELSQNRNQKCVVSKSVGEAVDLCLGSLIGFSTNDSGGSK